MTTTRTQSTVYTQQIATAIGQAMAEYQLLAKVGLRQPEGLLYVALEPLDAAVKTHKFNETKTLLAHLSKALNQLKSELTLNWVRLVKVSGRLPRQPRPLWQEELFPFTKAAEDTPNALLAPPLHSPANSTDSSAAETGDVNINIGGNMSAPLIVGSDNQLYSYQYHVEHGGVLNVSAPPKITPRPTPLALKPKPFTNLLDRQSVLPILQAALSQAQPAEVYAAPGFGKTTLMRYVAHWSEATGSIADGVVYLPIANQLAEDLLQSLYDIFYEAIPAFKPSYGQIQQALKNKRALIILNGLSFQKEQMEWLMAALPNCVFVLVSSERLYWQEGADIALPGLPLEDAIALIQQDLVRPLSESEKTAAQKLHQAFSGNPLQIRRAAAQAKSSNQPLDQWLYAVQTQQRQTAATHTGISDFDLKKSSLNSVVFTTATKKLSPAQKRVLALLGAMSGVALSAQQAQAIAQAPEAANALNELAHLQLVEPVETGYRLCADLGEAISQTFELQPWLQSAADYFIEASADAASMHSEAMLHLLNWTQQTGQWQQSLQLAQALDSVLAAGRQWQQWQQVLTHSLQAAQQIGDASAEAWALHQLGTRAIALNNTAQAETWLSRAVTLREAIQDFSGAAISRHNLGLLVPPLVSAQSFVPAPASSTSGIFSKFVGIGTLVGGLIIGGVGLALWLSTQPSGDISEPSASSDEVIVDSIEVDSDGPNSENTLSNLAFNNNSISFGKVLVGQSAQDTISITNNGSEPVALPKLSTTAPEEFSIIDQTCKEDFVAPAQDCTITVLFEPKEAGDRTSALVASDSAQSRITLPLTGTGVIRNETDLTSAEERTDSATTLEASENPIPTQTNDPIPSNSVEESSDTELNESEPSVVSEPETVNTETSEEIEQANPEAIEDEVVENETTEPDNLPPVVQNVDLQLTQGEPYTFNLLEFSQAYDPDSEDALEIFEIGTIKAGGSLEDNGDGTVTYYPYTEVAPDQFGSYQNNFEFTVIDAQGAKAYGTVFITVVIPAPPAE